jgi:hypothetical protein
MNAVSQTNRAPGKPASGIARAATLVFAAAASFSLAACANLEKEAYRDVETAKAAPPIHAAGTEATAAGIITEADLTALPEPAQRYFRHAGVVGKQRISSFSLVIKGRIRNSKNSAWMPLVMRQFNRIDSPARVVYIESPGKPMAGVDSWLGGKGRMFIKIASLITIADVTGREMDRSALVTFMNDLMLCPQAYFTLPAVWSPVDEGSFDFSLSYGNLTATARLFVDKDGRLVDWKSEDRYATVGGKNLPDKWSTPITAEQDLGDLRIPAKGSGVHNYDGTPFAYVELESIESLKTDSTGLPDR